MFASFSDLSSFSLLLAASVLLLFLYLWTNTRCHYWKKRGVPYLKPVWPVFGNMYDLLMLRTLPDITKRIYTVTEGLPYIGIYACHTPVLFVRNLDLIVKILVEDFSHFEDRGFHSNDFDPLARNLIHQSGPDWKFSRSKLAPCFNVAKVKSMISTMITKSEVLVEKIEENRNKNSIEVWDISLRYMIDVLVLCTIGVEANTLQKQEEFRETTKHMAGTYFIYHVFIGCFFPKLHKLLRISVAKARVTHFFQEAVQQVINRRKNNSSNNKDLVQVLIELKENFALRKNKQAIPDIDNNFILAQSFTFILAGYETPGNILACTLFELAKHPQIQDTVCKEIQNVLTRHGQEVTYDALQDMKYVRQVVTEALRKYTPVTIMFRRCTKDYTIPGTTTLIEKGTLVLIPLRCTHMDPDYYPQPDVFDPERFSDENSLSRHIGAYMPFGGGPRICPAVLYSHIKIRTALVHILRQFEVCVAKETQDCLQPNPFAFLLTPKNGIPLTFKRRQI